MALQTSYEAPTGVIHSEAYGKVTVKSIRKVYADAEAGIDTDHFQVDYKVDVYSSSDTKTKKPVAAEHFSTNTEDAEDAFLALCYTNAKTKDNFTEAQDV